SYSNVWVNGHYAGGWPYGYTSYQLDVTPYIKPGSNVLAIRLDNPNESSRWYPGGGIYRNVWLLKTGPVHLAHWGIQITTPQISASSATVNLSAQLDNASHANATVATAVYETDAHGKKLGKPVVAARFPAGQ